MKKVLCIKDFEVEQYDDEGVTDNLCTTKKGSVWTIEESDYRIIDGEIRLESEDGTWLELSKETFKEYFIYEKEEKNEFV